MTSLRPHQWLPAASLAALGLFVPRVSPAPAPTGPIDPAFYHGLVWRNVGPLRAGRIASVTGAIGQPGVFYAGLPEGGVWKTTSAGATWFPVFDSITTVAAVGAIGVAPSDPNVVYAGTGDMPTGGSINQGDGMYRSSDAGLTWRRVGLEESRQIPSLIIDPHDPNLVIAAAQGDLHHKSDARGVFRTTDGGATWTRTLFVDQETGIEKLASAFDEPQVVFATTDRHYSPPGVVPRRGAAPDSGPTGTALYKSTDEGLTWHVVDGRGLPRLFGRTSVAVAAHTNAQRVFLIGNFGLYRSDDGGATWRQMDSTDHRVGNGQGGYNCGVYVDPQNPDIVYTINTSSYISTDGGNTFTGFKGAPGGDDPQQMWIDPTNGKRILMGLDQGATVSLDGGLTWSPWYNQSTEQVYHISTDNSYPFWIYATQQDAGAVRTRNRGNLGEITPLDWSPVPTWEWGTIVPDPLHPDTVYASGNGIVKVTYPSEQWINVSPAQDPTLELRTGSAQPLVWAPWNQHELFAGFQYLMATTDGGAHWTKRSPDLGVPHGSEPTAPQPPARGGRGGPPNGGIIETIAPSSVAPGTIWVGTNNGLIRVTRDNGKTWADVSIPDLPHGAHADIQTIDASHTSAGAAYVAIDAHNVGDYAPYFYRTRDYGKTWTKIVTGLPTDEPSGSFAHTIRNDPKRAGLLFAGTESAMYVSFDDGDHWQSLQLNLPNTSYRDITFHGNDLIVGTYGRGIWVLDDYTVLRDLTPAIATAPAHLFKPDDAIRVRRNDGADTPFPPEVPHALNPPDGLIIYYTLAAAPRGDITLEVLDASGAVIRHLSSAPVTPVREAADPPEPNFWLAKPAPMPTAVGLNRITWDLRYDAPPAFTHTFEINANPGLTPASPEGPIALPGAYTIKLTVDGTTYTQPATVRNDPRSPASMVALRAQHDLMMRVYRGLASTWAGYHALADLRANVDKNAGSSQASDVTEAVKTFETKLDSVAGDSAGERGFRFGRGPAPPPDYVRVSGTFVQLLEGQDNGDMAPTPSSLAAVAAACKDLATVTAAADRLTKTGLPVLDAALGRHSITDVPAPPPAKTGSGC
ncbi:MAG TPA: hypothetical protein VJR24_15625 [Gemmatimonadaceae bacterium]|nr:hypothetical protein [Gemmatimonadaceae bacterium]